MSEGDALLRLMITTSTLGVISSESDLSESCAIISPDAATLDGTALDVPCAPLVRAAIGAYSASDEPASNGDRWHLERVARAPRAYVSMGSDRSRFRCLVTMFSFVHVRFMGTDGGDDVTLETASSWLELAEVLLVEHAMVDGSRGRARACLEATANWPALGFGIGVRATHSPMLSSHR